MQLTGKKTVLITGCTDGGIGSALAHEFNKHGYKVFASARRLEAMSALPADVTRVVLDVTSDASCRQAVDQVVKECGTLDVLINNAGIGHACALLDTPLELVQAHMDTNYIGAVRMIQMVAPRMMSKARRGLIINIGSGVGYAHMPFSGAYSASKHALHSVSDILRVELAPLGIDVMLVVPGFIKTSMVSNLNSNPMSKPSSYGYNAFKRSADFFNSMSAAMASSPQALAKRVVAAAGSPFGPPRHLALGTGIWWAQLEGWLPLWLQDIVHGALFELWPRGRAAAMMQAARDAAAAAGSGRGGGRVIEADGVAAAPAAAAAYRNPLYSDTGELLAADGACVVHNSRSHCKAE